MRKTFKFIGIFLLLIVIGGGIYLWSLSKPLPSGRSGKQADLLAKKMMTAVNKTAWDTTKIVQWTFRGEHDFIWDKQHHFVEVKWENNRVLLHSKKATGIAYIEGKEVNGEEKETLVKTAWSYFCNDAFWLNAPTKAFDPGTSRSIVTQEDGSKSLLVKYESGGVTPGDAYLWHLDKNGRPNSWQMWTSIIPIQGIRVSWEDWATLPSGAAYAQKHLLGSLNIGISNAKTAESLTDLGENEDLFNVLK